VVWFPSNRSGRRASKASVTNGARAALGDADGPGDDVTMPLLPGQPISSIDDETSANVPHILVRGADWCRSLGTAESPGSVWLVN